MFENLAELIKESSKQRMAKKVIDLIQQGTLAGKTADIISENLMQFPSMLVDLNEAGVKTTAVNKGYLVDWSEVTTDSFVI